MASTYSSLKIQLMATGENSGTWGNVTNVNLGTAIEEAIVGSADVTFANADVTLTLTNTNSTQTARNLRLNLTGTTGAARNLIVPAIEKIYIINNGCAHTVTVKNSTGTGIAIPAGATMYVYNNGTNVVDAITHLSSLTVAGDVGIGTSAPINEVGYTTVTIGGVDDGQLYVVDATGVTDVNTYVDATSAIVKFGVNSNLARTYLQQYTDSFKVNGFSSHPLIFNTANTERMRIDSSGNVGIGTSSPINGGKLSISASTAIAVSAANFTGISMQATGTGGREYRIVSTDNANGLGGGLLAFYDQTASAARVIIDSSGNVGIGINPSDVNLYVKSNDGSVYGYFEAETGEVISLYANTGETWLYAENADPLIIGTNNTERMRITAAGDVGIGTSTPANDSSRTNLTLGGDAKAGQFVLRYEDGSNCSEIYTATGNLPGEDFVEWDARNINGDLIGYWYLYEQYSAFVSKNNPLYLSADGTNVGVGSGAVTEIYLEPSTTGFIGFKTNNTERLRIASDGQLSAVVPGSSTLYPSFTARAWVNFNGTGTPAIRANGNVSSITDNGTGDYTVNFTTAMPDTNYITIASTVGTSNLTGSGYPVNICNTNTANASKTTSLVRFIAVTNNDTAIVDVDTVNIAIFR